MPKRPYDSAWRQAQARQTREALLGAARHRFLAEGFAATTVAVIASDVGVSVDTIYKAFGGKPGLVRAICADALAGEGSVPAETRSDALHGSETDPRAIIRGWGALASEVAPRVVPILLLIRDAAIADPDMAGLQADMDRQRLERMTHNARKLADAATCAAASPLNTPGRSCGHTAPPALRAARDNPWLATAEFHRLHHRCDDRRPPPTPAQTTPVPGALNLRSARFDNPPARSALSPGIRRASGRAEPGAARQSHLRAAYVLIMTPIGNCTLRTAGNRTLRGIGPGEPTSVTCRSRCRGSLGATRATQFTLGRGHVNSCAATRCSARVVRRRPGAAPLRAGRICRSPRPGPAATVDEAGGRLPLS